MFLKQIARCEAAAKESIISQGLGLPTMSLYSGKYSSRRNIKRSNVRNVLGRGRSSSLKSSMIVCMTRERSSSVTMISGSSNLQDVSS